MPIPIISKIVIRTILTSQNANLKLQYIIMFTNPERKACLIGIVNCKGISIQNQIPVVCYHSHAYMDLIQRIPFIIMTAKSIGEDPSQHHNVRSS